jgi:DNA-binding winged helix-turn-helix (wHTH) protein
MASDRWQFGDFMLDGSRGSLTRLGVEIALRPKTFALLQYLVEHPGRLVGKDELLSAVWPHVVVTDDSLTRCISEIRVALGESGPQTIKTVPRRGYLFDTPVVPVVPVVQVVPSESVVRPTPALDAARSGLGGWMIGALALSVFVLAMLVLARERPLAPRQTLVVLPFVALGSDAVQAPLADAITEDLTSAVARVRGLSVIASSTALTFKGQLAARARWGAS